MTTETETVPFDEIILKDQNTLTENIERGSFEIKLENGLIDTTKLIMDKLPRFYDPQKVEEAQTNIINSFKGVYKNSKLLFKWWRSSKGELNYELRIDPN